jgi:small nuclear ribonucleoprotein (snRNP)-like protein
MSKKGSKSKAGSVGKGKAKTASKPLPPLPSSANAASTPLELEPPKFPPFEGLSFAPTASNEATKAIQSWIGSPLRILLSDGRIIIGDLVSLDNYRNIILANTYQAHMTAKPGVEGSESTKQMGLILVPGPDIVKIERGILPSAPSASSVPNEV